MLDKIKSIEERLSKTTPGPWHVSGDINHLVFERYDKEKHNGPPLVANCGNLHNADTKEHVKEMQNNAEFIAHSREDIPYLLSEVKRLKSENERFKKKSEKLKNCLIEIQNNFISCNNPFFSITESNNLIKKLQKDGEI